MKKASNREALRCPAVLSAGSLGAIEGGRGSGGRGNNNSNNSNNNSNGNNSNGRSDSSATDAITGNGPKQSNGDLWKTAGILGTGFAVTGLAVNEGFGAVTGGSGGGGAPPPAGGSGDRFSTWA
jgi:hypothetical protein